MTERSDAALMAELRALWETVDPVPDDLADQIVTAIAMADFAREWELLSLVTDAELSAVRSGSETLTLQFSDGSTSVLLHVTEAAGGGRRVDGWVDGDATEVQLLQDVREWLAEPDQHGRFAFDQVPAGLCRLRLTVRQSDGGQREFRTPQFEV